VDFDKRCVLFIEGDVGSGKSRIVQEMKSFVQRLSGTSLWACADVAEKTTPLFAFRNIFKQLFQKLQFQYSWSVADIRMKKSAATK
jgi:predicted ATPase